MKNEVNCWKPKTVQRGYGNQQPSDAYVIEGSETISRESSPDAPCIGPKCLTPKYRHSAYMGKI